MPPPPPPLRLEMAALTTFTTRASSASLLRGHMASSFLVDKRSIFHDFAFEFVDLPGIFFVGDWEYWEVDFGMIWSFQCFLVCGKKKNQWIWILGFESGSSKFGWIWVFQESIWKQHLTNTFGFSEDLDMFLFLCLFLSVCSFVVYFFICLFARLRVNGFFLGENSIDGSMFEGFPPVPVHEFPESLTGIY